MTDGAAGAAVESDSELMAKVRDGELERLSELFERHHRRLFGFFLRLSGERSAAEDLVQEVFVRLLKYRHTFKTDAEFTPWMFTLARHAAVDSFRGRPKELQEDPEAPEPAAPATAAADHPAERLEQRERAALLHAALRKLAPEKRELLLLARFGEMRYDSIGELLGITVGAVKVRVHRALKELRAAYRAVAGEEMA